MKLIKINLRLIPLIRQYTSERHCHCQKKPQHLICFKHWTSDMVMDIIRSAICLKSLCSNTQGQRLDILTGSKVMILQEVNEPVLNLAVSKAATLLGAYDVAIYDKMDWDNDYLGRVFSLMAEVIFVSTCTHTCVQRFADQATVPVLCVHSRTNATIQALSTVMAIIEEFGGMKGQKVAYLGPPHQVLNTYLLLCPMLGADINFRCCCNKIPLTPLLYKISEDLSREMKTKMTTCKTNEELFYEATVIIAGPTTKKPEKIKDFTITEKDLKAAGRHWIFFHCCPRGKEVDDYLYNHTWSRTYNAFENFTYISAALMANAVKGYRFC